MDDPQLFLLRVWRQRGFRASVRATDEPDPHWFTSATELANFLTSGLPSAAEPVTPQPHGGPDESPR